MDLPELIREGEELTEWLGSSIDGLASPGDERSVLAASCFHIALEHHRSIVLLTSRGLHGSAFALVRLLYETLVRGLWLHHCATQEQIELYTSDKLELKFYQLLAEVEKVPGWDTGLLHKTKKRSWGAMNSFTHSGILQTSRRFNGTEIESDYDPEDISMALKFSGSIAILTGIAISGLADNLPLASMMFEKAKTFSGSQAP